MSRADGVLRVVLTGKWFDMIERGEKMEEYRGVHWAKRLVSDCSANSLRGLGIEFDEIFCDRQTSMMDHMMHPYHTLVASRGYTSRTMTRKIKRIRWGTPRPEWSGDTVTGQCFIIELEQEA